MFKVGDKVSWAGVDGVVHRVSTANQAVFVTFEKEHQAVFTSDGKSVSWHKEPSLKLIERAKVKVKLYKYAFRGKRSGCWLEASCFYRNDNEFSRSNEAIEFKRLDYTMIEVEE